MKVITILLLTVMLSLSSSAQVCETGEGNIFNATVILHESVVKPLQDGESMIAMSDTHCVGESFGTSVGATATSVTVWAADPLSTRKNGLSPGETFEIFLKTPSGTIPLPMEEDAIYIIRSASMDTTLNAVLDALSAEVINLARGLDSLIVRSDSLQGLVDNFPIVAAALQLDLVTANTTITTLRLDVSEAETRMTILLAAIRSMIGLVRN